jgi:putative heme-binding domain-containing protein
MTWHGIEASVPGDAKRAVELAESSKLPKVRELTVRRVFEDASTKPAAAGGMLALLLHDALAGEREAMLRAALQGLEQVRQPAAPPGWPRVASSLAQSSDPGVRRLAVELDAVFGSRPALVALRQQAAEPGAAAAQRKRALEVLLRTRDAELRPFLQTLLSDNEIGADAVQGLAAIGGPDTAETILAHWSALAPNARGEAVNALATRPAWALALVNAVQRGVVDQRQIGAGALRQLRGIDDAAVKDKIARIWPPSNSTAQWALAKYKNLLASETAKKADLRRGREVYQLACGSCHKLYGQGGAIGPELTGSDRQNLDYLLDNILSPSSVVPEAYRMSSITLKDERVLSGIVLSRNEQNLTLQTLTDKVTLPREEIESIRESELSMMPDGLLDALSEEQFIDLIGYLRSSSPAAGE